MRAGRLSAFDFFRWVIRYFRRRRMRRFERAFGITDSTRILDVGGTPLNWNLLESKPRIVLLNLPGTQEPGDPEQFSFVAGDGRRLPFGDFAFEIVCSNSVIEHLPDETAQREFAEEVRRVGRQHWVQTPNRWFPVEHHLLTPFLHFLPRRWQAAIVTRFSVWEWIARPAAESREFYISHYLNDIRLLDAGDLRRLFPDSAIRRERFLGLTKSLIAARVRGKQR